MTSWPRSAKQAPATSPTYPEPTTAIRIGFGLSGSERIELAAQSTPQFNFVRFDLTDSIAWLCFCSMKTWLGAGGWSKRELGVRRKRRSESGALPLRGRSLSPPEKRLRTG